MKTARSLWNWKRLLPLLSGAAALFLASCITGGSGSTETGVPIDLTGRVVGKDNAPVSGMRVTLAKAGISDTTDALGQYRIRGTAQAAQDSLVFRRGGQYVEALSLNKLIDSLPDVDIVQRDISGDLLPSAAHIDSVEAVISGYGIPGGAPVVAAFFYNAVSGNYSGFVYFPASDSVRSYSVYVKVFSGGHVTGQSQTVPFNSQAGDITLPAFSPGNAVPTAFAGNDTLVHLNTPVFLHGAAVDSFGGTISKWEWDIGGTGTFKTTSTGDTSFTVSSSFPRSFPCILRVTDNDGNVSPKDTVVVGIDSLPPLSPRVTVNPSGPTTPNARPTWAWAGGGGGNGTFRIKLDDPNLSAGATQTTSLSFTPSSDLAYGSHTLYVEERNADGNWSANASASIIVLDPSLQTLAIVGSNGDFLKTANGGATWTATHPVDTLTLKGAYFTDANTGWIAGVGGIHKTTDGGATWINQGLPNFIGNGSTRFVDANTGWIGGLRTQNGGATWTNPQVGFNSPFFVNANLGWALGLNDSVLKTTDGGATWAPQSNGITGSLRSVMFVNADTGWVSAGSGKIFKTTNGGSVWTAQSSGSTEIANAMYFVDATTGWIVGNNGAILKTGNGGATWTVQTDTTTNTLNSVYFRDANTGWAVGYSGTIFGTTNGGSTWTKQNSGTTNTLYAITPIP